jgi:hypothetical protein
MKSQMIRIKSKITTKYNKFKQILKKKKMIYEIIIKLSIENNFFKY